MDITMACRRLLLAATCFAFAIAAVPANALEGGFDCAEGANGEIEPYVWTGEKWVPNPDYIKVPTS